MPGEPGLFEVAQVCAGESAGGGFQGKPELLAIVTAGDGIVWLPGGTPNNAWGWIITAETHSRPRDMARAAVRPGLAMGS